MKVKLDKLTVTEVEVEMPDVCPHCGAGWRWEVIEEQYVCASETCLGFVNVMENGSLLFREEYDGQDCRDAGYYVTGYTCAACHCTIVSTETQVSGDQQERLQGV